MPVDMTESLKQHLALWESELATAQQGGDTPEYIATCVQMIEDCKRALERLAARPNDDE